MITCILVTAFVQSRYSIVICRICITWECLVYWRWVLQSTPWDLSNILKVIIGQEYSTPHGNPSSFSEQVLSVYTKVFDCVVHNKLWKILKEMGIPDHLTCLLRNLYAGQEATVRTGHGTTDWFQIRKGVHQGYILSPCLFNLYAEHIMRNAGMKHKLDSRLPGEIPITSDMQMTPPLWQKVNRN